MDKFKIGITGAASRAGQQLIRLLLRHPYVEIAALGVGMNGAGTGRPLTELCPQLAGMCDKLLVSEQEVIAKADVVINADVTADAQELAARCIKSKCVFIDLGPSFRLADEAVYNEWYGGSFSFPGLHDACVYGLPELMRDRMPGKVMAAVPGAVATAASLALAPGILEGLLMPDGTLIDVKLAAPECDWLGGTGYDIADITAGCIPGAAGMYRETPEIEQVLSIAADKSINTTVTAHAVPSASGLLVTCYAGTTLAASEKTLHNAYTRLYADERFVRVLPLGCTATVAGVAGTNMCDISLHFCSRTGRAVIFAALDARMKGGAGQAVQCMNILLSMAEQLGLE